MTNQEKENWKKVKDALEQSDKTDCFFYKRATAICDCKQDPLQLKDMP